MEELKKRKSQWELFQHMDLQTSNLTDKEREDFASSVLHAVKTAEEEIEIMAMALTMLEEKTRKAIQECDPCQIAEANRIQKAIGRIRHNFAIE